MSSFSQLPLADKLEQAQPGDIVVTDVDARLRFGFFDVDGNVCAFYCQTAMARLHPSSITDIIRPSQQVRDVPDIVSALQYVTDEIQAFYMAASDGQIKTVISIGQFARIAKLKDVLAKLRENQNDQADD